MRKSNQSSRRGRHIMIFALVIFSLFVGSAIVYLLIVGGDDDDPVPPETLIADDNNAAPDLNAPGPGIGASSGENETVSGGLGTNLPGCDDLDSDECPVPLDPSVVALDSELSSGGVTIAYPSRYFDATTREDGVLITITPSERNRFEFKGTFEVYFADSIAAALAELDDLPGEADVADWSTNTLTGRIGVVNDDTQDPFTTTAIGAFNTDDDRVIVLKATTTGKFGWYFHTKLYEAMLNSLTVAES